MKNANGPTLLPGISSLIGATNEAVRLAANGDSCVFITGEVGTEKAFAAKLVHQLSRRASRPLSKISVSWKLPPDLAQYFKSCSGGTLLIHLQKEFPVDMQYTLVEMASDGCFADPMSGEVVESDVRIILMTSLDLERLGGRTPLLPELLGILSQMHIEVPPLRRRPEDIPALVRYAIKRAHDTGRSPAQGADPQVLALFRMWHWPGNAEDLLLVTAQAAISCKEEMITIGDLPESFLRQLPPEAIESARGVKSSKPRMGGRTPLRGNARPAPPVSFGSSDYIDLSRVNVKTPLTAAPPPEPPPAPEPAEQEMANTPTQLLDRDLQEAPPPPLAEEDAVTAETPVPVQAPAAAADAPAKGQLSPRVLTLARRLNAQTQILSKQMTGPLEPAAAQNVLDRIAKELTDEEAMAALEKELDRGLELVLALRRQMAILNMRQSESAETIRDLIQRMSFAAEETVASNADVRKEASELAEALHSIDEIVQRVSKELPIAGIQIEGALKGEPVAVSEEPTLFGPAR